MKYCSHAVTLKQGLPLMDLKPKMMRQTISATVDPSYSYNPLESADVAKDSSSMNTMQPFFSLSDASAS